MNLISVSFPYALQDIGYRSPGDLIDSNRGGLYLILSRSFTTSYYVYDMFSVKQNKLFSIKSEKRMTIA